MDINFNSIPNHAVSLFKENIQFSLSGTHKKILIVVAIALGFLAACYLNRSDNE